LQSPEEIGVYGLVGGAELAIWHDDAELQHAVGAHAVGGRQHAVPAKEGGAGVGHLYEASEIVCPLFVAREMSDSGRQLPVKTMPMQERVREATEKGLNTMLAEYLLMAEKTGSALAFPKLVKDA
ncbi:hypothetical protein LZ31DRAFT_623187, partial [Colletotrichum somersetense]